MQRLITVVGCCLLLIGFVHAQNIGMTKLAEMGMGDGYSDPRYPVVACRGNLVAWGRDKLLEVCDATDPTSQTRMSRSTLPARIIDMTFIGDRLCWVRADKTYLADLSDPANPRLYPTPTPLLFKDIASSGTLVGYIQAGDIWTPARLVLMDVSITSQPRVLGGMDIIDYANQCICFVGNLALLANQSDRVHVVDISDPAHPTDLRTMAIGNTQSHSINDMETSGSRVYVAVEWAGIHVYDFSAPSSLTLRCIWKEPGVPDEKYDDDVYRIALAGNRACVTRPDSKIQILDLDDPSTITVLNTIPLPDIAGEYSSAIERRIGFSGATTYVPTQLAGILEIDTRDPHSPRLRPTGYVPGGARGVAVWGTTMWLANFCLMSFDLASATPVPKRLLPYDDPVWPQYGWASTGIAIRDGLAYCIGRDGFRVLDLSDSDAPVVLFSDLAGMGSSRISLGGHYAVVSDTDSMSGGPLYLFDIANPSHPFQTGTLPTHTLFGKFSDAVISGQYVYANDSEWGLCVAEISGAGALVPRGELRFNRTGGIKVQYPYAYVQTDGRLTVCDVSNPDAPSVLISYDCPGGSDMFLHGRYLFVAGDQVTVYDLARPREPRLCGTYAPHIPASSIFVDDKYVYLAGGEYGLELVAWENIASSARNWEIYQ